MVTTTSHDAPAPQVGAPSLMPPKPDDVAGFLSEASAAAASFNLVPLWKYIANLPVREGKGRSSRAGQGRAVQQGRAGQGGAGQGRAGQGRAGQGRAGQGGAGRGRAGQGRAEQGRASWPGGEVEAGKWGDETREGPTAQGRGYILGWEACTNPLLGWETCTDPLLARVCVRFCVFCHPKHSGQT